MAEIFAPPKQVKKPSFNWKDIKASQEAEEKYVEELRAFVKKVSGGKNVGEIIRFQVADGYAQYMVVKMEPTRLLHIDTGDGYQFEYAHLLNAEEIQKKLDQQNALSKIFGKKKS